MRRQGRAGEEDRGGQGRRWRLRRGNGIWEDRQQGRTAPAVVHG